MRNFLAALRYFTRLPVPNWVGHAPDDLARGARWLPAIGLLVGLLGVVVTELAALVLPSGIAILLGMAATLLATGAFHEDGLADACDGFGGGWDKAGVLRIMKDSRVGSYALIGVGLVLFLKWSALNEIDQASGPYGLGTALLAAHAVSRLAAVIVMSVLDYARDEDSDDSKARPLTPRLDWQNMSLAVFIALLPCLLLPLGDVLTALVAVGVTTVLAARYFVKRIGGYTGDCLGATQQVTEIVFYLSVLCSFI